MPVADNVPIAGAVQHGLFSASNNGVVSIQSKTGRLTQPVWVDRTEKSRRFLLNLQCTPTSRRREMGRRLPWCHRPENGSWNIWILRFTRAPEDKVTSESSIGYWPVWSPDCSELLYSNNRMGATKLFSISTNGIGKAQLFLPSEDSDLPASWSTDGRFIAFFRHPVAESNKQSLWILPTTGDKKAYRLIESVGASGAGRFFTRWEMARVSNR